MRISLTLLFCAAAVSTRAPAAEAPPSDDTLLSFAKQRSQAVRITEAPEQISAIVSMRCAPPRGPSREEIRIAKKQKDGRLGADPHATNFVHVYVSPDGASAMRTNSAVFPRGAIVLKEKFADATGKHTLLFTGMIKREPGYNPDCGDWEFFTLSPDAANVTARGRLHSCMDCHEEYQSRDFVTKNYVTGSSLGAGN